MVEGNGVVVNTIVIKITDARVPVLCVVSRGENKPRVDFPSFLLSLLLLLFFLFNLPPPLLLLSPPPLQPRPRVWHLWPSTGALRQVRARRLSRRCTAPALLTSLPPLSGDGRLSPSTFPIPAGTAPGNSPELVPSAKHRRRQGGRCSLPLRSSLLAREPLTATLRSASALPQRISRRYLQSQQQSSASSGVQTRSSR